ncbi:GGDEF domain-containing protein [Deinococcus sonorensis]|uniref:GGDEF domain-containing protein n=2 Tax=Deinococcus sonorensis TaxID=309891 RepID=A0AAU7U8V0_9DEIO
MLSLSVLLPLAYGLLLVIVLAFAAGLLLQPDMPSQRLKVPLLLAGAVSTLLLMLTPWVPLPGVLIDLRLLPPLLLLLTFGPRFSLPVLACAVLARLIVGGAGVVPELLSGAFSWLVAAGLWRGRRTLQLAWWEPLVVFGAMALPYGLISADLLRELLLVLPLSHALGLGVAAGVLHSRAQLVRLTRSYQALAHTDPLTGLLNRRQFQRDLEHLQPHDHLILLDIDHFKQVNDRYGHDTGDRAIQAVGAVLEATLPHRGRAYRIGGEEFAVVLPGRPDAALALAQRIWQGVRLTVVVSGTDEHQPPSLTCSLGVAQAGQRGIGASVFRRADSALYAAKRGGRDQIVVASATQAPAPSPSAHTTHIMMPDEQAGQHTLWATLLSTLDDLGRDAGQIEGEWDDLLSSAVMAVPGAEAGSLLLLEDQEFVIRAQHNFDDRLLGQRLSVAQQRAWYGPNLSGYLAGLPRLRTEPQQPEGSRMVTLGEAYGLRRIEVNLCVPVVVGREVVALLNLDNFSKESAFAPESLSQASAFARKIAALLQGRERRQREQRHQQELQALLALAEAWSHGHSVEQVARALCEALLVTLNAHSVVLLAPQDDALMSVISLGQVPMPQHCRVSVGEGLTAQTLGSGQPQRYLNVRFTGQRYEQLTSGGEAALMLPLDSLDASPALVVVRRPGDRPFQLSEELLGWRMMQMLAAQLDRLEPLPRRVDHLTAELLA